MLKNVKLLENYVKTGVQIFTMHKCIQLEVICEILKPSDTN